MRRRQLMRRRLQLLAGVVVLAFATFAWVKIPQLAFFEIRHISITGASAVPDLLVRRRIDDLVENRSVFEVDTDRIEREVEKLPFVHTAHVDPHRLQGGISLHVSEYEPLAFAIAGENGWLVARDGRVLVRGRIQDWRDRVPVVRLERDEVRAGQRVGEEAALRLLRVVPPTFPAAVRTVEIGEDGIVARLHDGPQLRIGGDRELRIKLQVVERLLTMLGPQRRESIEYIDVSVPERPAAKIDG